MKVVVIGSTGTIGRAVVQTLAERHEVVGVSRQSDPPVDLENSSTVLGLFRKIPRIDAVICCAGRAAFKPLAEMADADFALSLRNKLMGQVNLVRLGLQALAPGGSITVTSGQAAQKPSPGSSAFALVNAGLEGFVRAAALEAPQGVRVNAVSPPWVAETVQKLKIAVEESLPAAVVARAYLAALEDASRHGQVIDPSSFR